LIMLNESEVDRDVGSMNQFHVVKLSESQSMFTITVILSI